MVSQIGIRTTSSCKDYIINAIWPKTTQPNVYSFVDSLKPTEGHLPEGDDAYDIKAKYLLYCYIMHTRESMYVTHSILFSLESQMIIFSFLKMQSKGIFGTVNGARKVRNTAR